MSFIGDTYESRVDRISYYSKESLKTMQLGCHSRDILYQPCTEISTAVIITDTSGACP
jgi:hypothetical protein